MRVEVAVVGGGIIGALVAYTLRKGGLEVLLLDAGFRGAATEASAGMLAPHPEGLGGEGLRRAEASLEAYPTLLGELEGLGLEVPADFSGVWLALPEGEGPDPLPYPVRGSGGAKHFPGGWVHPVRLREALLGALLCMGGQRLRAEVLGVEGGRVVLREGELQAERVVLAVGAWGERFGLKVRPLKGEALLLRAPAPPAPLFFGEGYLLPREGGVYLGATQREGWTEGVSLQGLRWLVNCARRFPLLEGGQVAGFLWGFRPLGELFVGEVEKGVLAATGHGRNGVLLAPWTARRLAELLGVRV